MITKQSRKTLKAVFNSFRPSIAADLSPTWINTFAVCRRRSHDSATITQTSFPPTK